MENKMIFLSDEKVSSIFLEAREMLGEFDGVYLIGGMVRNSLFYQIHGEEYPLRDFDLVAPIKYREAIYDQLIQAGFIKTSVERENEDVFYKKKFPEAEEFKDKVYFDIHYSNENSILKNLEKYSTININGNALAFDKSTDPDWPEHIVSIEGAIADIKSKVVRLNKKAEGNPTDLYACLRFISLDLKPEIGEDLPILYCRLSSIDEEKFIRNQQKTFDYIGSEERARALATSLGISEDIFNFEEVKKLHRYCSS